MKTEEIIKKIKIGSLVKSKQVLYTLQRNHLIYDYSKWGYLRGAKIYLELPDETAWTYVELFEDANAPEVYETTITDEKGYYRMIRNNKIKYKDFEFETQYVSGCFKPYLKRIK